MVLLQSSGHALAGPFATAAQEETAEPDTGPSPISPEPKELLWGLGAFLVLLIAMRLYLVPKVKKGMDARYGKIRTELETAEAMREAARAEVDAYEAQLAAVRSEASARIDAARQVLDGRARRSAGRGQRRPSPNGARPPRPRPKRPRLAASGRSRTPRWRSPHGSSS